MCVGEERRGGAFYKSPPMSGSVLALCSAALTPSCSGAWFDLPSRTDFCNQDLRSSGLALPRICHLLSPFSSHLLSTEVPRCLCHRDYTVIESQACDRGVLAHSDPGPTASLLI